MGTRSTDAAQALNIGAATGPGSSMDGYLWDVCIFDGSQPTEAQIESDYEDNDLADASCDARYKLDENNFPTDNAANSGSGGAGAGSVTGSTSTPFTAPFP